MENAGVGWNSRSETGDLRAEAERAAESAANLAIETNDLQEKGGFGNENATGFGNEQAVRLGSKVLTYNPEQVRREADVIRENTERIQGIVNTENGIEKETLVNPSTVGVESRTLFDEYQKWDEENLKNELRPNRDSEAKMAAHDQGGVVEGVMSNINAIMNQTNPRVMDFVNSLSSGRDQILENAENPRRVGDRN